MNSKSHFSEYSILHCLLKIQNYKEMLLAQAVKRYRVLFTDCSDFKPFHEDFTYWQSSNYWSYVYKVKCIWSGTSWKEFQVCSLPGIELLHIRQVMVLHCTFSKHSCTSFGCWTGCLLSSGLLCSLQCNIISIPHSIKQGLYKML